MPACKKLCNISYPIKKPDGKTYIYSVWANFYGWNIMLEPHGHEGRIELCGAASSLKLLFCSLYRYFKDSGDKTLAMLLVHKNICNRMKKTVPFLHSASTFCHQMGETLDRTFDIHFGENTVPMTFYKIFPEEVEKD